MKKRVTYCNETDLRKMDDIIGGLERTTLGNMIRGAVPQVIPKSARGNSPQYKSTYDEVCDPTVGTEQKNSPRQIYIIDSNKETDTAKCCRSGNLKPEFYDSRYPSRNLRQNKPVKYSDNVETTVYDGDRTHHKRSRSSMQPRNTKLRNPESVEPTPENNCIKRRDPSCCEEDVSMRRNGLTNESVQSTKAAETMCEGNYNTRRTFCNVTTERTVNQNAVESPCDENYPNILASSCSASDKRSAKAIQPCYETQYNTRNSRYTDTVLDCDERIPTNSSDLTKNSRYTSNKNNEENLNCKDCLSDPEANWTGEKSSSFPRNINVCPNYNSENDVNMTETELNKPSRYGASLPAGCNRNETTVEYSTTRSRVPASLPKLPCSLPCNKRRTKSMIKCPQAEEHDDTTSDCNAKTQLKLLKLTRQSNDRMIEETLYLKDIQSDTSLESIIMNVNIEALQHKKTSSDIVDLVRGSSLSNNDRQVYYFQGDYPKIKNQQNKGNQNQANSNDEDDERMDTNNQIRSKNSIPNRSQCKNGTCSAEESRGGVCKGKVKTCATAGKKTSLRKVDSTPPACVKKNQSILKQMPRESSPDDGNERPKPKSSSNQTSLKSSIKSRPHSRHDSSKDESPHRSPEHSPKRSAKTDSRKTNNNRYDADDASDGGSESNGKGKKRQTNSKRRPRAKQSNAPTKHSKKQQDNSKIRRPQKNGNNSIDDESDELTDHTGSDSAGRRNLDDFKWTKHPLDDIRRDTKPRPHTKEEEARAFELPSTMGSSRSRSGYESPGRNRYGSKQTNSTNTKELEADGKSSSDRKGNHSIEKHIKYNSTSESDQYNSKDEDDIVVRKRTHDDNGQCFENRIYILLPGSKRKEKLLNSKQEPGNSDDSCDSRAKKGRSTKSHKIERFNHVVHSIPNVKLNELQNYLSDPKNFAQATFGVSREVNAPATVNRPTNQINNTFEAFDLGDGHELLEKPKISKLPHQIEVEQLEMKVKGILTNSGAARYPLAKNFTHELKISDDLWETPTIKVPAQPAVTKNSIKSPTKIPTKRNIKTPIMSRVKTPTTSYRPKSPLPKTPTPKPPTRNSLFKIQVPVFSDSTSSDEYCSKPALMFSKKAKFNKSIKNELGQQNTLVNEIPTKIPVSIQNRSIARLRALSQPRRPAKTLPLPNHNSHSTPTLRSGWSLPPSDRIISLSRPKPNMQRI